MKKIELVNVPALEALERNQLTVADVPAEHIEWFNRSKMNFNKDLQLKGKYCYHPFNTVTIDSRGECYVCTCQAWLPISVGNILDFQSLTDIVRSPKAREIQASIIDGTYRYCDNNTCHLISRGGLEGRISHRPDTVNWIVFAIDESCNLTCPSCRTEMMFYNKGPEFEHRMRISNHIIKLIENHHHFLKFTLSGDGDPFASHVYRNILENLQLTEADPVEIEIVTNGILAKDHWDRMSGVHKHINRFKISFDAGSPEVYEITRRGGNWNKLIESAEHVIKWKQKNYSSMDVVANFVVQNANYKDIHNYVRLTKELGFDEISFQRVTDWGKWTVGGVNYFTEHAVWMDTHPNHQELVDILNHPMLKDSKIQLTNLSSLVKKSFPKLSELVKLKNTIQTNLDEQGIQQTVDEYRRILTDASKLVPAQEESFALSIMTLDRIEAEIENLNKETRLLVNSLGQEITRMTANYHKRGYKINGAFATNRTDVTGERTLRMFNLKEDTKALILASIGKYADWRYPGLEIGPGDGIWTGDLVACEPLYIVDIHQEFLDSTKQKFNEEFQRKICDYVTTETDLAMLPQNQFGFVFSWNVFNHLTTDLIDRYLDQIYSVLRPGGYALISYNNAEREHCAMNVEQGFMSYVPKFLLKSLLEKYQFDIIAWHDHEETVSWVEFKKPGELTTIKAHSTLGILHEK